MSKMSRHNSTLFQCFMWFLLLWPGIVDSFPTTDLVLNNRHQRVTSEAVVFSQGEELDLVLQSGDKFLQFEMCCNKEGGCNEGSFQFCFQTTQVKQGQEGLSGCGGRTCSYKVTFQPNGTRDFSMGTFKPSEPCFKGKIDDEKTYAISATGTPFGLPGASCPLDLQPGNRLKLHVKAIPDGVTVTATNAQKYVEPTTTLPPSTAPSTAETTNATKEATPAATTPEAGMSDALKYSLIGVGIFVFILIVGGIGFAIYWFCFKKKKSSKPVPPVTVAKTTADATPVTKEAALIISNKTFEPKPKTTTENETQDVKRSKHAPSNVPSKHAALSDVVPSAAAAALIPLPPPPMASKDFTASKEPNDLSLFDDESERDGKSQSKKSREQTSFSKEVAATIDKKKIKKKAMK